MKRTTVEIWKPVVGYEGLYEVSNHGRVRSLDRDIKTVRGSSEFIQKRKGVLLAGGLSGGYRNVSLHKEGVCRTHFVHRMVLEAFVGPCPPGRQACHWNDVRTDNRLENLRWSTKSENQRDAIRNGKYLRMTKTECPHGHAYTPENTMLKKTKAGGTRRYCRECNRIDSLKRYHKHRNGGVS